jgi:hypothetical protein
MGGDGVTIPKITDFGLARRSQEAVLRHRRGGLPQTWLLLVLAETHRGNSERARRHAEQLWRAAKRFPYSIDSRLLLLFQHEFEAGPQDIRAGAK